MEELQSSAFTRPSYYQDQLGEGGVPNENWGAVGICVHQRIDEKANKRDQNKIGDKIQFKGLKCGIEIHSYELL